MGAELTSGRRAQIMMLARERGRITIGELADLWNVSHETIRRDLKALEESGSLMRVHGGAVLPNLVIERPIGERLALNRSAKDLIAAKAVSLVREEMSLFLDASSTTVTLAHALGRFHHLTVVTNSLEVARLVGDRTSNRVIMTGGEYRRGEAALLGFEPVAGAKRYHYDIAFSGIVGLSAQHGLMDFEPEEAELRRALFPNARHMVVLADASKFNRTAFVQALTFSQITDLVTDAEPPAELARALEAADVMVHIAGRDAAVE